MDFRNWLSDLAAKVQWWDLLIALGIAAVFLICRKIFVKYVFKFLIRKFQRYQSLAAWMQAFEKPLSYGFVILGVYFGLKYALPLKWELDLQLIHLLRSGIVILIGWGIYNVSAASSTLLEQISRRFGLDASSMLIPFLSKTLRFVIVLLIVTIVGSEWGFSINGVVAGMGLGSLAIALAAKETLGNMFGGIVIILEKPFAKGEWILTPSVEGIVEDITFRSTQVRTFADSVVTVPNSIVANQPITNWSRMGKRRVSFNLKVAMDSDRIKLERAIARLEDRLTTDDQIDPAMIMVRFNEFQEGSLGIFFYFFTKTTVWKEYLAIRQELNFAIMQILEEEGIRLAYPVQQLFVETSSEAEKLKEAGIF
ncbi:MscS family membrane protein [Paenibacillus phyllosphaerae]|uniref:MscS family membrane protein n=1 Tax=Paenibacillus phyllosphaerae TaxID=274593 RepID=A0A7W5AYH6_9BACL|nr:mechanosensitive ion channel family protein [Paenibacillus phyllosphaerae]MBB3111093.1 MscS family membrane protein [Paenibacillus phyllosphaerae]